MESGGCDDTLPKSEQNNPDSPQRVDNAVLATDSEKTSTVKADAQSNPSQEATAKIRLGICCMEKKLSSRPMREILKFLDRNVEIEICRFNNVMLLEKPIEEWLRCDVLIGFYSTGFPH